MDANGLERSRPRVNGTTQNAHMLSQPRMMDTNAAGFFVASFLRTGAMSAYVSSTESCVLITDAKGAFFDDDDAF